MRQYDLHSFVQLRRKDADDATIETMHNQTNASMASVALIETDEKMKVSSGPVKEKSEEKRLQLEDVDRTDWR
jgi:hypothetical protein